MLIKIVQDKKKKKYFVRKTVIEDISNADKKCSWQIFFFFFLVLDFWF